MLSLPGATCRSDRCSGAGEHRYVVVAISDGEHLVGNNASEAAEREDAAPFRSSRRVDGQPVLAVDGFGEEHRLHSMVDEESADLVERGPRESEQRERVDRPSRNSGVQVLDPRHRGDVRQVASAGRRVVRDKDVEVRMIDVDAWVETDFPEGTEHRCSDGWVEDGLMESLVGAEVDTDRTIDEHGRSARPAAARLARTVRGRREVAARTVIPRESSCWTASVCAAGTTICGSQNVPSRSVATRRITLEVWPGR